ncbi:MAG: citramalate synthase [Microcoleus sp. PH2017_40_RAT_O_B]|uniref:citramalate synthase n=1 Tax=unclassified Microcoleus TaxID=2642155 RepID=UPI001E05E0C1|nr:MULTISPECIES: citramalate synthase [unclassified Microcoleus]MCC3468055.1 citramalate synthase [Microcoleus sp. PH2017_06_SFM_O_A]TAE53349.1 MAG: citramalate synthase [Oscillatoriales cyanobacterium]MCC3439562.1 citramalate synthase [Microcoleus sp. PH2017_05_CCC_O_A]MCC3576065.1 citramalate synthase [Microcoleus sp. PH2017_34_RAT_O_A]MCC3613614.1 citramalate synthase [Microcoleus sp. PH2017_40_RAT_O_B]
MKNRLWIYDTTLRDGAQCEGLCLSLEDKVRIARQLDSLGIPFIEGGWPGANPKDVQFFWRLKEQPLIQAEVVAFCSTRRPGKTAANDEMLQPILSAGTRWVTLFGKSWDLHVIESLKTTLEENLAMIRDTIEYLRSQGRRVIYDAEHWFDGYKHNPEYAIKTLMAAADAGAEWLVLCDTNGGTLPDEVSQVVRDVLAALGTELTQSLQLGIHTHNDSGVAVANALAGVREGVTMVQGTINGYGERCGNANLCSLIPNFQLKLGYDCIQDEQLAKLTQVSRSVSEIVNLAPDDHAPFVGLSAFAHKGGIHVSAVEKNPLTYEHLEPEKIGNIRRIVISDQSGLSNVLAKAKTFGIELDRKNPACRQILEKLKDLESQGYQFEGAEASFELLMREALEKRQRWFEIHGFQVHCDKVGEDCTALATVKLSVNGTIILECAEGNGPVSALDAALRKALVNFYPAIAHFYLTDYKVRILDSGAGTSAKTRVFVEFSNGQDRWTTVGVSGNILDASCQAVVEGLEYGLVLENQEAIPLVCRVH